MEDIKSVVMVGAGPSALAAAIYTTREGINITLYEKGVIGGLAAITDKIDNYPGFPEGVPGMELADNLRKQAERFAAKIEYGDASALRHQDGVNVLTVDGKDIKARTVLIATGSDYKKLGVPGEAEFYGRGVHYCATCDGAFYKGKRLVVVGGGNSGVQEAMFLTRFAEHIDLLVRSTIKASKTLQDDLQKYIDNGKITVHLQTVAQEIVSKDDAVASVRALKDGTETVFEADGVFVFIGLKPNTQFLADSGVEFDEYGLVKTNNHLATNLPGVFASGDVRSGATMQVASAVGEGATAALSIREYLESVE